MLSMRFNSTLDQYRRSLVGCEEPHIEFLKSLRRSVAMKIGQPIKIWTLASAMSLALCSGAWAQQTTVPGTDPSLAEPPALPSAAQPQSDLPPSLAARQANMLNQSRQKQLVLDTQRLVALANELKIAVDKSNKDTLSLDVIRKADEIEKLAHSVKEKMKGN
jgi:hypothetical protein